MLHFFASNLTTSTKIISIFVFADCYITDYLKLYCIRNSFFKKLGSNFRYSCRFSPEIADKYNMHTARKGYRCIRNRHFRNSGFEK